MRYNLVTRVCLVVAQHRGPGSAGSLQDLDEEPTYRWRGRLSEDDL